MLFHIFNHFTWSMNNDNLDRLIFRTFIQKSFKTNSTQKRQKHSRRVQNHKKIREIGSSD